jgi:hypothetical protein
MKKSERIIVGLILLMTLLAAVPLLNKYVGNSDQISYITVAQKYLAGNFKDAVNGYWSPLFSWLMVPLLALKMNAVIASQLVALWSALLLLLGTYLLTLRLSLSASLRLTVLLILAPTLLLCYVFIVVGPDLLVAALLVFYLSVVLDPEYGRKTTAGFLGAALGALAYLAKAYAFYFFIAHFFFLHAVFVIQAAHRRERLRLLQKYALSMVVFLVLCAPWIGGLSAKYGGLLTGTTTRINFAIAGPESRGHPQGYSGFIPPPNATALSTWEDPSRNPYIPWSPFRSKKDFNYWLHLIARNLADFVRIFLEYSILSIPILVLALWASAAALLRKKSGGFLGLAILTLALYSFGYLALFVLDRYVLIDLVLIVILGTLGLNTVFKKGFFYRRFLRGAVLAVYILSFLPTPLKFLPRNLNHGKYFLIESLGYTDAGIYQIGRALKRRYDLSGNMASNFNGNVTLILSYYLNLRYFGCMRKEHGPEELKRELAKYGIDYFFLWFESGERFPFLKAFPEITRGKFPELKIYQLRNPKSFRGQTRSST